MDQYRPNQPYGYELAESGINALARHHHVVPPPDLSMENKKSMLILSTGTTFSLTHDAYGDPSFVLAISRCQPLRLEHVQNDWKYKDKYSAQAVLPFLFLGPMTAARDRDFVRSKGITMVIAIRDAAAVAVNPKIMDPARYHLGDDIETATFDVSDQNDLVSRFRPVIKLMNDHLKRHTSDTPINSLNEVGGKILVFCEAGDTRSPSLVVLYLMAVFGLDTASAIQAVQSRRFGILIVQSYNQMISNAEQVLRAEREVARTHTTSIQTHVRIGTRSRKRTFDEAYDEDQMMLDSDDANPILRPGTAPFTENSA